MCFYGISTSMSALALLSFVYHSLCMAKWILLPVRVLLPVGVLLLVGVLIVVLTVFWILHFHRCGMSRLQTQRHRQKPSLQGQRAKLTSQPAPRLQLQITALLTTSSDCSPSARSARPKEHSSKGFILLAALLYIGNTGEEFLSLS